MVATTKKMGPSQAPVCEAFIMTGETILKTYTNKSETRNGTTTAAKTIASKQSNKTVQAADTTTPGLNATISATTATTTSTTTPPQPPPIIARTTIASSATKTDCPKTNNYDNNNNEGESKDYIKHAQYRVAAALEQRAKSVSLGKLSDPNYQHHRLTTGGVDQIKWPSKRVAVNIGDVNESLGLGGDTNRGESQIREEASARVRFPVHERQEQLEQRQQRQQKHLHEHVGREENSQELGRQPLEAVYCNLEPGTKQLKDCEYSIGMQVDLMNKQHEAQQQKQLQQQKFKQPHQMDQRTPAPVTRTATFIVTPRQQKQQKQLQSQGQDQSKLNGGQRFDADDFSIQFKTGFLNRKRTFEARGKPTGKGRRSWRRVYVILRDLRFIVRHGHIENELDGEQENKEGQQEDGDSESAQPSALGQKMEEQSAKTRKRLAAKDLKNTIRLHHSFAKRSTTYTKREYVFHLYLADQSELLLQASSESEMNAWIDTINFASACLSSPPLPNAVSSSSKRYHHQQHHQRFRPILPASYTKLSYWEQLTDHEERLERLKAELEEHLNEAPVKRHANKRSKSEFIDKIAYLRQKIEHYTVYLDLMQKKSNSPEAIVLSKHPQIASLTPSKEMVRVLPLNAKAHADEDKKDTN